MTVAVRAAVSELPATTQLSVSPPLSLNVTESTGAADTAVHRREMTTINKPNVFKCITHSPGFDTRTIAFITI
jgi:hypothetical protein